MRSATLFLLAAVLATGCDTYDDHFHDDGDDDAYVRVIDFQLDIDDASANGTRAVVLESDDIRSNDIRDDVEDALRNAGDGALVLLYADNALTLCLDPDDQEPSRDDSDDDGDGCVDTIGTWTALPVTKGYEATLADDTPYVDVTVTFSYSFDNDDLYFDVTSSGELNFASFLDSLPPDDDLLFRLVTVEADVFYARTAGLTAQGKSALDLRNYEQVKAVFGLPD